MRRPDPAWPAAALRDATAPLAGRVTAPVTFHRAWVHRGRVVVLDYLVHGAPVAFDLGPDDEPTRWRVELLSRCQVDTPVLARLGLERVGPRRFLVDSVGSGSSDELPRALVDTCVAVLDRLAALGPVEQTRRLLESLAPTERAVVVDVGANPLELPAYTRLLGLDQCRVIGFEPQPEAYAALQGRDPAREVYLPHALGRPGPRGLHVFRSSGFTSTFAIDETTIDLVGDPQWRVGTELRETLTVDLTALDDVPDLPAFDLLKIDVQGGELDVFRHGRRRLATALCVVPEVSFFPLYRDAPTFADVHQELLAQGFHLHKFLFQKSVHLHGSQSTTTGVRAHHSQLVDGDAVYLRDLRTMPSWPLEQVKTLVLLATYVFDSPDLAVRALDELVARGAVADDLPASYAASSYV
ncbi:FkbM family methyltransferase [Nocardioides rubriscoriae]|uniref:FkbM family methyltransferase n=1 Tax=Nocardioides rubriscoriae TaxID=642762 RepID=UPI0011E01352|nr:FkbM family methyltransferase [Nocardioides rubriscoriae]